MIRRPILFGALVSVALAVGALAPTPAMAEPINPLTASVDKAVAHPGDTVEVTVTFTNHDPWDVVFSYMSMIPTAPTAAGDVQYAFSSCAGQLSWCSIWAPDSHGVSVHHDVTIPPGGTREVRFSYQVAAGSPCGAGRTLAFYFYSYRETTNNATAGIIYDPMPTTSIACAA
jgi:FtsP/CotA-like multicopper oxidase with cupredoxin domain